MAQLIGVVRTVVGNVVAVAADGTRRALVEGDRLYAGDVLDTGASGAVAIHLQNGQDMTLGRDSTVHLSADTLATNVVPHVEVAAEGLAPNASALIDVDRIQAAIAAGQDPSVNADPTAAGATPATATGSTSGGGHTFVLLDAVGGAVAPTVGFATAGQTTTVATAALFVNPLVTTTAAVVDNPVTVGASSISGLNEANLDFGSNPLASALTRTGSLTVSAPDGLTNLSVAGVTVLSNGALVALNTPITTALGNLITITGLNASNGAITYRYTLQTNENHAAGNGANNFAESISVVGGDSNGSVGTGAIIVNITDDVPRAVNDVNQDGVDENVLSVFGNVLENDIQGADLIANGPITAGTFTGIYGTLVIDTDGSYSYTVNANAPAFVALGNGGSGTDTFTYTLNDSDGDTSTATLAIDVNNADSITISDTRVTVSEANLPLGSSPNAAALTTTSSFVVAATAGLSDLSINGTDIVSDGVVVGVNQPITTALGDTLRVTAVNLRTGQVSYSFTLNGAEAHATGGGANNLALGLSVVAIDNNGTAVSNSITVNLTDDVPRAVADSNGSTASATSTTLTGNVLTNDVQGADRISSGPISAGTFTGTYGTLVLGANGAYTYTLNTSDPDFITLGAGGRGSEAFTYTLNDADGDTSTAVLTLNVANGTSSSTIGIAPVGTALTLNEANLSLGSAPNAAALTQTGNFTVTASAGLNSLSINGVAVLTNGALVGLNQPITTSLGNTVVVTGLNATTGAVTYTYTLNASETHANAAGANNLAETFSVVATDKANVSASGSITVNITDDVPRAVSDTGSTTADAAHLTVTGSVLSNDVQGADRMSGGPVTPATLTGTYGSLVLNSSGNYIYTLNTSDPDFIALGSRTGTETFTYTLNDADGDTSTAALTLTVGGTPGSIVISGLGAAAGDVSVNEANLALGSAPNAAALTSTDTFVVSASNGFNSLSVAGVAILTNGVLVGLNQAITTGLGNTLTVTGLDATTGLVTYTYRLAGATNVTGAAANTFGETLAVVATDRTGTSTSANIVARVTDDVPTAVNDSNSTAADATHVTLTGNVLTNDTQGADRITGSTGPITPATITGTYGVLVLGSNGAYTYSLNTTDPDFLQLGGRSGTETFTYTLRDADGDTSTANLVLNVTGTGGSITIVGIGSNDVAVTEANLALGSAPNAAALTQTDTFTVNATNGLNSLSVGGVAVLTNGVLVALNQPITTSLGNVVTVTGLNADTGLVTYTYRLAAATNVTGTGANVVSENVQVVATDRSGVSTSGNIVANITDDVPRAVNDTGTSNADATHLTLTGNVLSNDIQGADRIAAGPITATTLNGTYGSLVLNSSGSYTYTLNTNGANYIALGGRTGTETFTYTLNDSDGDRSTATLTLNVAGTAGTISIPGIGTNDITVNEANLALGSAPNAAALSQTHSFTVNATAGLSSLSVGGVAILTNGVLVALNQPITTSLGNTITVTGLDATTGLVTYTYQLTGNTATAQVGGANTVTENIAVRATDSTGTSTTANLVANVVDDVPRAVNDTNTTTADAAHLTLTGSVLGNDVQGADRITSGPVTAGTFTGTYGTLTLAANGTYTYALNTTDPDYLALAGRTGTETFTYTLNDSDRDTSTATLTLNVAGAPGSVTIGGIGNAGGDVTLNEANLALGSVPNAAALTQSGSFTVNTAAGLFNLSIAGVTVLSNGTLVNYGAPITTASGNTLRITGLNASNGVVTYTYTLNANEAHPTGNGANLLTENLAVVAGDRAGATGSSNIVVKVTDDVPTAVNDTNGTVADATHLTLTGSVLSNDTQGADRISNGPVTAGTFTGTYGTLVLGANGSYTYTLNTSDPDFVALGTGGRGTETFRYTLNDADGDTSTANLVLSVGGPASTAVIGGIGNAAGDVTLTEANLALGSSPNSAALTKSGSFTVTTASGGLSNLSIAGATVLSNGALVNYGAPITTASGNTLRITGLNATTGLVTYTYTLVANEAHPTGNGANVLTENLAVVAVDRAGASASGNIVVKVTDDVPTAVNDTNSGYAEASSRTLTGNVLTNDTQGADRISSGPITAGSFTGTYGTLVLGANGAYTYTLNTSDPDYLALTNGARGTERFTYTLKDSDGDTSTAVLTLTVGGTASTIVIGGIGNNDVVVNEANLALGSAPNASALTQSHTFNVTASAGLSSLSVAGVAILTNGVLVALNQPITTSLGNTITVTGLDASTGLVTYSYQLTGNTANAQVAGANTVSESIAVTATDSTGKTAAGNIVANVIDDVPRAVNDSNGNVADEAHVSLTGNVLSNDVQGADRIGTGPITGGTFAGTYGSLVLNANGSYTYTLNTNDPDFIALRGGATATESFTYTLKDSDGDVSAATLTLNISNANDPVTLGGLGVAGGEITVYEANLTTGSSPDVAGLTRPGTFTVSAPDGLATLTVNGVALVTNGTALTTLPSITGALGNTLTITGYNAVTGVVSYTYRLVSNEQQAAGANSISEDFTVVAGDRDGSSSTGVLNVNIVNDSPIAINDVNGSLVSATNQTVTGNVLSNDILGADRVASGPVVSGNFTGTYGTLTLNANGTYSYTLNTNDVDFKALGAGQFATDNFTYTLRDSDGDTSSARLQMQISGGSTPTVTLFRTLVVADDSQAVATASDFTAATLQTIAFTGAGTGLSDSVRALERADFTALSGGMAAALLVTGYLAATSAAGQVDQESFSVNLKQGETLTLDPSAAAQLGLQLVLADGSTQALTADHAFTATQDGTYTLHVSNASTTGAAEDYSLALTIGATTAINPDDTATGTHTDAHYATGDAGSTAAVLTAASTGDHVLVGSDGNDVLTAGSGNDSLFGGKGDDLLIAGSGNDLLNGGDGNDTVSYQNATAGVHVSLAIAGQQDTVGAGYDTLVSIENLIGSAHDDILIGNDYGNVLNGGAGNDILIGGAGNDTLIGGPGNNTLTGGAGSDTFLWQQNNSGHDTVTDFAPGSDTLDLSQLLQGHNDAGSLDDYLHFKITGTGDNLVSTIEVSSSAAAAPTQTIDLQGVNLATQYGVAPGASGVVASNDAATIINGMLTDHSLKVDTV